MSYILSSCQLEAKTNGSDLVAETEHISEIFCDKASAVDMPLNHVFMKLIISELGLLS